MPRRFPMLAVLLACGVWASSALAVASAGRPGEAAFLVALQQPAGSDFVPVSQLPDTRQAEQIPAAPMLIAAYIVVWLALLLYLWSLWRRLATVEREVADVARRVEDSRRS